MGRELKAVSILPPINIDFSKTPHRSFIDLVAPLLPGFFFEACFALACPDRMISLIHNAPSDRYVTALILLLFAFVLGAAFMSWVGLIHEFFHRAFRFFSQRWPRWLEGRIAAQAKARGERMKQGQAVKDSRYRRLVQWLWNRDIAQHQRQMEVQEAWGKVATVLLKHYGIEDMGNPNPWVAGGVLGDLSTQDIRGSLIAWSLHATGWAGLVVQRIAPSLHARAFLSLCWFFICIGVWRSASRAWVNTGQISSWYLGLHRTFAELKDTVKDGRNQQHETAEPDQPKTDTSA